LDHFKYKDDVAFCEDIALTHLADTFGTPVYVYSETTLRQHCRNLKKAFEGHPTLPCFAVKANSNLTFLQTIFSEGFGADLVSLGELERALLAGVNPKEIVFSGVGKKPEEIRRALEVGILSFNVESQYELKTIAQLAKEKNIVARVCLRINPNIDAKTNPKIATGLYTTKFGLAENEAEELTESAKRDPALKLVGLACHIGSQITELGPLHEAAVRMAEIAKKAQEKGHQLEFLNMGGGLGIRYKNESPPSLQDYANALIDATRSVGLKLVIEPGRVIAGNAGVLLTKVIGVKKTPAKHFIVVDAAMNDLVRPTLYNSFHEILPAKTARNKNLGPSKKVLCDFVGPICETGDYLGKDRLVDLPQEGDLFFIRSCGAYGSSMASQYNSRPRAPEVFVQKDVVRLIRPREKLDSLWAEELSALNKNFLCGQ
jgi:diaminopimelate decarboxylase